MARNYGYRVSVVQVYQDQQKNKDALEVSWGSPAAEEVLRLLDEAHARETHFFEPRPVEAGEPEKPTTSLTVDAPVVIRSGLVHVEVSTGEVGTHRHATRPGKKPKKLKKRSAEAQYFVAFLFSEQPDDRFLIITQVYRRRDPVARLLARMQTVGLDDKKASRAAQDIARDAAKLAGEKPPKREAFHRLVFDRRQAADDRYLESIVADAKKASAVFTGYSSNDRGEPVRVERTLSVALRADDQIQAVRGVVRDWMRQQRKREAATEHEGVTALADSLSDDLVSDDEAVKYDKAAVSVTDTSGESTRIAVDNLRDVFTYPVSDGPPGSYFFYAKVSERLDMIAQQESIEVAPINAEEVAECLGDSI